MNDIGDKGGKLIIEALPDCPQLEDICLNNTKVTDVTAKEFIYYFVTHTDSGPNVSLKYTKCNDMEVGLMEMIINQRRNKPDSFSIYIYL